MDYEKGYVYDLMDQGGPTDNREPYFKEAVEEMMRARTLCAKANATLPDDPGYVSYLEELFGRKLDDVRILTPFICDFGNRVKFGKGVFINHSAILSASGGIEFEDGVMSAPGLRIATINHDMNQRHTKYTYRHGGPRGEGGRRHGDGDLYLCADRKRLRSAGHLPYEGDTLLPEKRRRMGSD